VLVVLDTNVVVAGLRSRNGASFQVLSRVATGAFEIAVSVPLVLEYEDALLRQVRASGIAESHVSDVIDYLCSVAVRQEIFFLWRPQLRDPGDDLVLEIAVAAGCDSIVTHNVRDFRGADQFGIRVVSPAVFLSEIRGLK
jgi:putative PIN family toxin of toxin-antitoxin system